MWALAKLHAEPNSSCEGSENHQLHAAAGMVAEESLAAPAQIAAALVVVARAAGLLEVLEMLHTARDPCLDSGRNSSRWHSIANACAFCTHEKSAHACRNLGRMCARRTECSCITALGHGCANLDLWSQVLGAELLLPPVGRSWPRPVEKARELRTALGAAFGLRERQTARWREAVAASCLDVAAPIQQSVA